MVKRVALARALALEPEILFLDEPTAGLDPAASKSIVELIDELHREFRLTIVMVTHDLETLIALCDRVAVLADRKIIVAAPIDEVIATPHPFIQSYFLGERGDMPWGSYVPQTRRHLSVEAHLDEQARLRLRSRPIRYPVDGGGDRRSPVAAPRPT